MPFRTPLPTSRQFLKLLRRARWAVPLALFLMVAFFESYEHGIGSLSSESLRTGYLVDLFFFGIVGPIIVALALHWMGEVLDRLVQTQEHQAQLYRELQEEEKARRQLLSFVINAQEEERKRVARNLHDGISQSLTAFVLVSEQLELPDPIQQRKLATAHRSAQQALDSISQLIPDLRPPMLDRSGLVPTLRRYVEELFKDEPIRIYWQVQGQPERFDGEIELLVYRVLQEATSNVYRHARAQNLCMHLDFSPGGLKVFMRDDGQGFNRAQIHPNGKDLRGVGLLGMEERTAMINGCLKIKSKPGQGTELELYVPYKKQAE